MTRPGVLVDVDGQPVHVVEDAAGDPPLLLTSGLGGAWYDWSPLMPHLPTGHRLLRLDRPGLGESPGHGGLPTLDREVELLAGVIERFCDAGAVVVAHSLAGLHAEALARTRPELVRGLVLVDVSNGPPGAGRPTGATSRLAPVRGAPTDPSTATARLAWSLAGLTDRTGISPHLGPPSFTAALRLLAHGPIPDSVRTAGRRAFSSAEPAAAAWCELLAYRRTILDLSALRRTDFPAIPGSVVTAIGDLPRGAGQRWIERHRALATELGARHRVVPDAGHFLAWHRPATVAAAVDDVLGRVR